jgi:hypothetical protein
VPAHVGFQIGDARMRDDRETYIPLTTTPEYRERIRNMWQRTIEEFESKGNHDD